MPDPDDTIFVDYNGCLARGLFTINEALERIARPDIRDRRSAELVRAAVSR